MRRKEEFYCDPSGGGCGMYFTTYLRDNMTGTYTIKCPNETCLHEHFRQIISGLVTTDRRRNDAGIAERVILGLKATLRSTPWHNNPNFRRSIMKKV